MELILKIDDKEYSVSREVDNPDADNVMFAIESLVSKGPGIDTDAIEEYVIGWAEEIQNKRLI